MSGLRLVLDVKRTEEIERVVRVIRGVQKEDLEME